MGNCWTSQKLNQMQSESTIQEEEWYFGNDNFDSALYNRCIVAEVHSSFDRVLSHVWKGEILADCVQGGDETFNTSALDYLRKYIHIGVPNKLVRVVILKVLQYDDEMARRTYTNLIDSIDDIPDLMNLSPTMEPLYGRKSLSNCFLTLKGSISCKRILYITKLTIRELAICPILPRFVQLMLWHFREYEVYQLLLVLLNENTKRTGYSYHFPRSALAYKEITVCILSHLGDIDDSQTKALKVVIKDMLSNLLVEYISPTMYSVILCYFISDGVSGCLLYTSDAADE